jgi:hypothetical protein
MWRTLMSTHSIAWPRLLLPGATALSIVAAGGGDDPVDVESPDTLSATVDGVPWSAVETVALVNNETFFVVGTDPLLLGVGISFPSDEGPGTYTTGSGSDATGSVIDVETMTQWTADPFGGSGTITVTHVDELGASGTFSFSAPLSMGAGTPAVREVTDGVFDVRF